MGRKPNWTLEELEFLVEHWGAMSIKNIAKRLNRSIDAVKIKAGRIGLSDNRFCVDGITLNQLALALHTSYSILKNWVRQYDFPAHKRILAVERHVLIVRYEDFWKWAQSHKHLLNFGRVESNILGPEPDWVAVKRKADLADYSKIKSRPWSMADDRKLRSMISAYRYTYPQIASALKRTEGAVKRRLHDLGIKGRPLRLDNHVPWETDEVDMVIGMYDKGHGLTSIAKAVGRSELAVRGLLERRGFRFRNELRSHG